MSRPLEVLLASFEAVPFAKVGGLADVAGALPDVLASVDINARLVIPCFGDIDREAFGLEVVEVPGNWAVGINFVDHPFRVWRGQTPGGRDVWLLGDDHFFGRPGIYADPQGGAFEDELERIVFFSKGVLELAKCLEWRLDVIHANDFQTALALAHARETYAHEDSFRDAATVYSIHNLAYQGLYSSELLATMGFGAEHARSMGPFEFHGNINLMKVGISYADVVHTVSPTYAREILGEEQGAGLEGVLEANADKLRGILNGIDGVRWNPENDPAVDATFSASDPGGKREAKRALLKEMGVSEDKMDWPLVGCIGRLVAQKGVELIVANLDALLETDACFIALGSGSAEYEAALRDRAERFDDRCHVHIGFDDGLAHRITAGADIFLMPSHYEPCGLNQMYAMRYGTIPVVRRTGGLADTVEDWNAANKTGRGFVFDDRTPEALADALGRAINAWSRTEQRDALIDNMMTTSFDWAARAPEYRELYEEAIRRRSSN